MRLGIRESAYTEPNVFDVLRSFTALDDYETYVVQFLKDKQKGRMLSRRGFNKKRGCMNGSGNL